MISSGAPAQGIALHDGTNLIGIGNAAGSRPRVAAGGITSQTYPIEHSLNLAIHIVYTPGDTSSRTFSVHAINNYTSNPDTLYVNRSEDDRDLLNFSRGSSSLTLMEVSV